MILWTYRTALGMQNTVALAAVNGFLPQRYITINVDATF